MYLVRQSDLYFFFPSVMSIVMLIYWQLVDCTGQVSTIYVFGQLIFQQVLPLVGCTAFSEFNFIYIYL